MLPRAVTVNTTGGASGIKGEGETHPRKTDKLLRILVVEDNPDSADSLRLLLEFSGHEVAVAYSGHDGVQAAEQHQPDVLIAVTAYGRDEDRGCLDNELAAPVWPLKVNEANERLAQHQGSHRDQLITFRRQPGRDATIWRAELASRFGGILRTVWGGSRTWAGVKRGATSPDQERPFSPRWRRPTRLPVGRGPGGLG